MLMDDIRPTEQSPEISREQALEIFPKSKVEVFWPNAMSGMLVGLVGSAVITGRTMRELNVLEAQVEEQPEPPQHLVDQAAATRDVYWNNAAVTSLFMVGLLAGIGYKLFRDNKRDKKVEEYKSANAEPEGSV